ncbi:helicase-exonuclease AddAB subunit AddA, partial [Adlercreutzia equolifaciens]
EGEEEDVYRTEVLLTMSEEDGLEDREREALAIAGKIRRIVGTLPVVDKESGELRPAGYGDIVILLRTTAGWDEVFKKVLEKSGIPVYITSKTGYFAATEVQTILNFLKVLSNPLQDIPLFGVLKSDAAGFTDEDIACMKAEMEGEGRRLFTCLTSYTEKGSREELCEKARRFCSMLERFRRYVAYMPIHQLIEQFLKETGYLYTISALPGGEQRRANVEMLLSRAENFEKTSYFGLFHFIRYMEQVEKYNIDYGEANIQDENADTVRIMSINKSKGLDFPVCFVAGLSKKFNMQDT